MHQRLDVVAHRLDVDVLVDQLDGLRAEGVPEQLAVAARRLHRLVHLRQPAVVGLVGTRHGSGDSASQMRAEHRIFGGELVPHLVVRQALLRGHQTLVAAHRPVHAGEERQALLHLHRQRLPQLVDVRDDLLHRLLVEVQRPRHVVEDADVVHDQTVRLLLAERAVRAADGLQKVVVLHRLVEIHHLQDRRVEAGEQLADVTMTNFSGSAGSRKRSSSFSSASLSRTCCFHSGGSPAPTVMTMALASGADQLVHHRLVEHAAFAVEDHHLRLEAVRLHLRLEVRDDVLHHGADALRVLHQHGHLRGALGEVVAVLLAQVAGDLLVGFVDGRLVDLQPAPPAPRNAAAASPCRGWTPGTSSGSCSPSRPRRRRTPRTCSCPRG